MRRTAAAQLPQPRNAERAVQARRAVLAAELTTQRAALAAREADLQRALDAARAGRAAEAAGLADLRALRQSVAWHRESLERLAGRLTG
ncbi:hypothetical protein D5H78_07290 [Vallicoccus soli]|uniref:Uncharacterized protein n=2 Tax=Vallicoccus soli TaxID=2339232 RepID=A0A3A3ZLI0_9ACTN|nr:hypothetical protein D5H78_07290 [Vallicoccus soli]